MKKKKIYRYNANDWDESKKTKVIPDKIKGISTSIRLPKSMIQKLQKVAKRKGEIGYQTLLKIWIAERLEKEIA
jgi:hypothetical protein